MDASKHVCIVFFCIYHQCMEWDCSYILCDTIEEFTERLIVGPQLKFGFFVEYILIEYFIDKSISCLVYKMSENSEKC